MKNTPKKRFRLWVTGDENFQKQWNQWTANQGVIGEDALHKILTVAMAHGEVSFFDAAHGYHNSKSETEPQ